MTYFVQWNAVWRCRSYYWLDLGFCIKWKTVFKGDGQTGSKILSTIFGILGFFRDFEIFFRDFFCFSGSWDFYGIFFWNFSTMCDFFYLFFFYPRLKAESYVAIDGVFLFQTN